MLSIDGDVDPGRGRHLLVSTAVATGQSSHGRRETGGGASRRQTNQEAVEEGTETQLFNTCQRISQSRAVLGEHLGGGRGGRDSL